MEDLPINLPPEIQKPNFRALDGLRGVAILIVIYSHVLRAFPPGSNDIGLIGVYIFFVISGFLITTLLLKERLKYGNINLKGFYLRRCFRILPVAFLYLIVMAFLNTIYKLNIERSFFLSSFLFVRNLPLQQHGEIFTGHFWSLAIEEQFYLIFPFFIVWLSLRNYKRLVQYSILMILLLSYVCVKKLDTDFFHVPVSVHLLISWLFNLFGKGTVLILIGSLFSILLVTQNKFIRLVYNKAPDFLSLLLFLLGVIILTPVFPWHAPLISSTVFGIMMAFVIILNLKERSLMGRLLENKPLKTIGILSYSLYIWQQIFTYKQPWHEAGTDLLLITANLIALGIIAWMSYYLYERKILAYKNRFKRV
ncbi:hypothetical protein A4H97_33210 [Niastella yeongjuensis]|uniref:Acyltransferase 3 domain-containing protein n=1 Tax=Niastella yeongjuensis TaxID=354355 RepID=A0A1V9EFY6_9BACT|nr:acyltransferase [Niastella yeongjuensis]OQP45023.1 hypothetical protein A4H97_33210 [Niastella yeongjuensis]